jgi:hypothetical protein
MINFIEVEYDNPYYQICKEFINPIIKYLPDNLYKFSNECQLDCVNVIFFTENGVKEEVKMSEGNGINVFISHGIADKNWRTADRVNDFDFVCVSGDLWKDKLIQQGLHESKIILNGYTKMDNIFKIQKSYIKNKPTILFAPTHNTSVTCYDKLNNVLDRLKNDYEIIISEHPFNKIDKVVTSNEYLEADVVIADFGSSMYEAWALNKPCVFADWLVKEDINELYPNSFEDYIYNNSIDYHANNEDEFIELIEVACEKGITNEAVNFIDGIFNKELRGNSGEITANILKEIDSKL